MLRRAVELLSRNRALPRTMRVGERQVPLWVSPDAQLRYLVPGAGAFDYDLVRIAERLVQPKSVVWDVGANLGIFALAAATMAPEGTTIAIEADIWLAGLIRRSSHLGRNKSLNLHVLPCAVTDHCGVAVFDIAARGRASSALRTAKGRTQMGGRREAVNVPCLTLDAIAETVPIPELIKIDVEGAEAMVLRGAERLLTEHRPVVYIEVGGDAAEEVAAIARQHGYQMLSAKGAPITRCELNTFLVPDEKVESLTLAERLG